MEVTRFEATGYGMLPFPHGTERFDLSQLDVEHGVHIMGSAVPLWLTRLGIDRWGDRWAGEGGLDMRFRTELFEGHGLNMHVDRQPDTIDVRMVDDDGVACVTARLSERGLAPDETSVSGTMLTGKAPATHEGLTGLRLQPLSFVFETARDLHMVRDLEDSPTWIEHGWAHPAWLASSANAMIRRSIDFGNPPTWINAGTEIDLHAVVRDGETVVVDGSVNSMFDRGRHRFAVIGFTASVGSRRVMSMRYTLIYASNHT